MKYFRWKCLQKTAVCCVLVFLIWEMYYVIQRSASDGSTVMGRLIDSVLSDDQSMRQIRTSTDRVISPRMNTSNPDELKVVIEEINSKQYIRNGDRLGLRLDGDSVVIIVQVHDRVEELKYLVESLERARYISKCLVIFSHDVFSDDINDVIGSILSFPVLQVYYPYSLQLYPTNFPGQDPSDCPRDIASHRKRKCNNMKYPDTYGHYREAKVSQMKHHWVWQLYHVIEEVRVLSDYTGTFFRLDEDYYVSEDAIHVLYEMNKIAPETGGYELMVLGEYDEIPTWSYKGMAEMVRRREWYVGVGRGMAFRRQFWAQLKSCSHVFCTFDDYNWDWSLQQSVKHCLGGKLNILQPAVGRVFHAGLCHGFHRRSSDCSAKDMVKKINNLLLENEEFLFPKLMYLTEDVPIEIGLGNSKLNGGWADPRDRRFCISMMDGKGRLQETIRSINEQKLT